MGVYSMFEESAIFTQFLDRERKMKLDRIIQKVIFNMNEGNTMSSGITGMSYIKNKFLKNLSNCSYLLFYYSYQLVS